MALARSGPHLDRGREQYQDELSGGAFRIQRPVDSLNCNEDTLLCLRSLCSSGVSFTSGLAELIGRGGLQLI